MDNPLSRPMVPDRVGSSSDSELEDTITMRA
jgi:hypothetical protein